MTKILILGGAGNFGKRIARGLVKKGHAIIIAGRDAKKLDALVSTLPPELVEIASFDMKENLAAEIRKLKPAIVINTCGPFQNSNYDAARTCIDHQVHYIDLADGRDFVNGISVLDAEARAKNVTVISGASTVPGLSSAVIEQYKHEFQRIDEIAYGISPGQQTERGLATTEAILSYVGKPLRPCAGVPATTPRYGWQDLYWMTYPELGKRWMANCDIPDLDLFYKHYSIPSVRFSAGLELGFVHLGLWALSWLVRWGLPLNLPTFAKPLLAISNMFNSFGTADGGMHVILRGLSAQGSPHERRWFIIAKDGDGPNIPCVPAIALAHKIASGEALPQGAYPCVGLITLDEYMDELKDFDIRQVRY